MKNKEVFAEGYSFKKLFLVFVIASILGAFYEEILNLVRVYLATGVINYEVRRGVIYGPFSPVYGAGAVGMVLLLAKPNYSYLKTYLYGGLLGGFFEYLISFLQEVFTHTTSWDYSQKFLNINGRTTIPFMLVWGLFSLLFVKIIYPYFSKWVEMISPKIGTICFYIIFIFLSLDMLISWSALIRSSLRRNDIKAVGPVGRFYDRVYPDHVLAKSFPNMKFKRGMGND